MMVLVIYHTTIAVGINTLGGDKVTRRGEKNAGVIDNNVPEMGNGLCCANLNAVAAATAVNLLANVKKCADFVGRDLDPDFFMAFHDVYNPTNALHHGPLHHGPIMSCPGPLS